jgi:hypothetical protein
MLPTLSEIIEVRKDKHGIVEITAVQEPERSDGKPMEIDLVARSEKLKQLYDIVVDPQTKARRPLLELEIDCEHFFFVDDGKGGNWLEKFL